MPRFFGRKRHSGCGMSSLDGTRHQYGPSLPPDDSRLAAMAETGWTKDSARNNESFCDRYTTLDTYLRTKGICGAPKKYWNISEELAKEEMEIHNQTWYTPENMEEFEKQNQMMAEERAIYGDER